MNDLLRALESAVVMREIDLSEIDPAYVDGEGRPVTIPCRVNWTRRMVLRVQSLATQQAEILRRVKDGEIAERIAASQLARNRQDWYKAFANILMIDDEPSRWQFWRKPGRRYMTTRELKKLDQVGLFDLLGQQAIELRLAYIDTESKKATGKPMSGGTEPADANQTS